MQLHSWRLALACVLLAVAPACTGGGGEPAATPSSSVATGADGAGPSPRDPSTSPGDSPPASAPASASPSASPSPTPPEPQPGTGTAVVAAPDGVSSTSTVGGDCMVSGPALPAEFTGDALADDVEVLIGVDNFVGPLGQPDADRPLVVVVDGEADDASVELRGGPVEGWSWWQGPVAGLQLGDPVVVDGVTRDTAELTARLERAPRDRAAVRAPQPSPTASPERSPTASPTPGRSRPGAASPTPSATPTAVGPATGSSVAVAPVSAVRGLGSTALTVGQPSQGVQALDVSLELACTVVP